MRNRAVPNSSTVGRAMGVPLFVGAHRGVFQKDTLQAALLLLCINSCRNNIKPASSIARFFLTVPLLA